MRRSLSFLCLCRCGPGRNPLVTSFINLPVPVHSCHPRSGLVTHQIRTFSSFGTLVPGRVKKDAPPPSFATPFKRLIERCSHSPPFFSSPPFEKTSKLRFFPDPKKSGLSLTSKLMNVQLSSTRISARVLSLLLYHPQGVVLFYPP